MSAEFGPEIPSSAEQLPQHRLMAYFRGQFYDALQKEYSEAQRDNESLNGSFIQRNALKGEHELTRGTRRIIMKPPHPNDIPGYYCEVFAVRINIEPAATTIQYIDETSHFLVRDYTHGRPGPFWLVDSSGAHVVDVDDLNPDNIISIDTLSSDLNAIEKAKEMFDKYSGYNIVATAD